MGVGPRPPAPDRSPRCPRRSGPPRCGLPPHRSRPGPKGAALAGHPSSCGQSRAAHGHQSLSGAEPAWRTSLVRHLESDLPQTYQTQPSHPLRDLVLAADRTSCPKASANQFRLFLHAGAYWLLWSLRALMPKRSPWRVAQFDTLRLRLIKIAARVVELKTMIRLHLPTACPDQAILRAVLGRIPRLVT